MVGGASSVPTDNSETLLSPPTSDRCFKRSKARPSDWTEPLSPALFSGVTRVSGERRVAITYPWPSVSERQSKTGRVNNCCLFVPKKRVTTTPSLGLKSSGPDY
jgi:hypothetical protein